MMVSTLMRAKASLTITSTALPSAAVSERLGLEPDHSYDIGDPVSPKRYPHGPFREQAFWSRSSGLPDSASLAEHLLTLIGSLEPRRDKLCSIRGNSKARFFCGLFGGSETTANFEIPVYAIKWCSEVLDIVLDCFACHDSGAEEIEATSAEADDEESHENVNGGPEPDRSFSYLETDRLNPLPLRWPHETNGAESDQLLPRPRAAASLAVVSNLPEDAAAEHHVERLLDLARGRYHGEAPIDPTLVCLLSTDRLAGSFVRLEIPILRQLAQLGAGFRISLFQTPPVLRRRRLLS